MRKLVSSLVFVVVAMLVVFSSQKVKASHAAGAEIIYVHIADSTYQFFFKFYRDCSGISEPPNATLCFYNTCTQQTFNVPMQKWQGTLPPDNRPNGSPVSAGCSQYPNRCTQSGSNLPGYREWWYSCIATLPLACDYWKFAAWINARNPQTNITPGTMYVETTFNSSFTWDNSSPYYSVKPIPYVCLNQAYSFNNGALDADGDSLYSVMINPLNHGSCSTTPTPAPLANLTPPINFTNNPLQTGNTFNLNGFNGQMNFTATLQGAATITMRTDEYYHRNSPSNANFGKKIGSIMRDVQVQVLPCSTVAPKLDTISVGNAGSFGSGLVYGCIGEKLEFCFVISSTDTSAILLAEDNLSTAIPGAVINYTNLRTDSVRGCFEWTPTVNDAGNHSFLVVVKDSTCKPPGILLQYAKTVDIRIWGPVEVSPDTSICIGEPAFLGVTGGSNYSWDVLSGTPNSLSNPNVSNPVATPTTTTTYKVESTINPYCPAFNKDTVTITVLKGPDINGQDDTLTCPNVATPLDVGIIQSPNVTYTVTWTPGTGLSSTNTPTTVATLKTPQEYFIEVGSSDNRCTTRDTVNVDVLTGFSIENPDTAICLGERVDVRGEGDSRYNYEWTSTDNNAIITTGGDVETGLIPSQIGTFRYTLTAGYKNCPDSTADFDIDLQPVPTVAVNDDESMCYGDTMQLNAIVTPNTYTNYSYDWTPGAALDFPDRSDPIFSAVSEGVTDMQVIVSTPAGCSDTGNVELNVFAASFIEVPSDTSICPGDSISLNTTVDEGVTFYWLPDLYISSISSLQPTISPVTDQVYTIYGVDTLGCLDTAEVAITVNPRAIIDMPDSVTIYPGEGYRVDPGGNCLYYTWFPPLGLSNSDVSNPMIDASVNTRYIVQGRTESGCSVTDSLDVIVKNESVLDLPNAFTPGRRDNGTLKVINRGVAELKTFAVYNRWGTKVFETSDIQEGWDGTYSGENQPMGVYIYTIEAITPSGRTLNKQGNVTLIR